MILPTSVRPVVSLQLAALREGLGARGAVEDSGLLGAGRRPRLVHSFVFLQTRTIIQRFVFYFVRRTCVKSHRPSALRRRGRDPWHLCARASQTHQEDPGDWEAHAPAKPFDKSPACLLEESEQDGPAAHAASNLQVCRPLEGLVAHAADVAAVLAVSLLAVAPQRVGIVAHLAAVVTLVPMISLGLGVLHTLRAIVSNLSHTQNTSLCI